jgi:hypothetical protein
MSKNGKQLKKKEEEERHFVQIIISSNLKRNEALASTNPNSAGLQYNLAIRIPKLSPKTKDNARYPYNEVWHTAKLIPAEPGRCILISSILIARFYCSPLFPTPFSSPETAPRQGNAEARFRMAPTELLAGDATQSFRNTPKSIKYVSRERHLRVGIRFHQPVVCLPERLTSSS